MTIRSATEIERTFEFSASEPAPDLVGVGGIATVQTLADELLDATYYDTADFRLASQRTTLRRRRGGRDAGWHLKLPLGGDAREEITTPLGRSMVVPGELRTLVLSRVRAEPVRPVVRLRTERTVRLLLDGAGSVLAEFADDRVVGETLGADRRRVVWRELEVELVAGDHTFLDAVGKRLVASGARASARPSKLARTLEGLLPASGPVLPRHPAAADAVLQHLHEQLVELISRDPGVRRDAPDAVHKMRVATRRLRSALLTYRRLLDRDSSDPMRAELKHLAAVLGEARDAEVLRARLVGQIAELPAGVVKRDVIQHVDQQLKERHRQAHARVLAELNGPRYLALLGALDAFVTDPPWQGRAERPAGKQLRRRVGSAVAKLDRAVAKAEGAPTAAQRDDLLHEVRKTAKQVRYAAESTQQVLGSDAIALARRAQKIQEVLGDHQDSVVSRERLLDFVGTIEPRGETDFVFGVLYGQERARTATTEDAYLQARQAFSRKKSRAWLS